LRANWFLMRANKKRKSLVNVPPELTNVDDPRGQFWRRQRSYGKTCNQAATSGSNVHSIPDADRVKIAIVIHALEGGGAQRDTILLANALAAKGVPIALLALRCEGSLQSMIHPAVRVVKIPGRRIRHAVLGLRKVIRTLAPRIVLSSESSLNLCSLAAIRLLPSRSRPKLIMREVSSPSVAQSSSPNPQNRIAYRILRHLYRHADRVITLTDGAKFDLVENFRVPVPKISVMHSNAVVPPEAIARLARWDGETGREPNLIVCVGRLSPEKGHLALLRAMTLMPRARPWRLAVIGDGDERAALEGYAQRYGLSDRVSFVGYAPDPFAWLMRAQVAVCCSVYEGLGNAIIEALACGTAVVSTDCPFGPREILQHGRYGQLIPMGNPRALASGIETALDQPVDRRALMARGLCYTAERSAAEFLDIAAEVEPEVSALPRPVSRHPLRDDAGGAARGVWSAEPARHITPSI
jgi:glycosyltransferase involved in cell wall biosynthesis